MKAQETQGNRVAGWLRAARRSLRRREFRDAEKFCRQIIDADPENAEGHYLLALLAMETGQLHPACKILERAVALDGAQGRYHAQLASLYVRLQQADKALVSAECAAELRPKDALTLDTIGCVYSYAGQHREALPFFEQAIRQAADNPQFQFNYASSLRFLGDFDAAEVACEKAIAADSGFFKAHWSLAFLRKQTPAKNHLDRLNELLASVAGQGEAEAFAHNALAKELEDLGEDEKSFTHLQAGKQIIRQRMKYSVEEDRELFGALMRLFDRDSVHPAHKGFETDEPVFIVGMPRTGTTLVDRILSSHSDVFSAGELRNFSLQLKRAAATKSNMVLDEETIEAGLKVNPEMLGRAYLESTRPATGHTPKFVDKTPLNFMNIGFIHRALPNARIICMHRNPMDSCLSNYRQMFAQDNTSYYRYSYDLLEAGQYYLLFHALMSHWDNVLPDKILHVQYEEVVANQEEQSRRIISHCGLEWQDACLEFEKNAAPVATASSVQVRQPIYKDATARWKRYEKQLQPLREFFESNGLQID